MTQAPGADTRAAAIDQLLDRCARRLPAESAAELSRLRTRGDAAMPAVVVVGETKRGKSSLVNALLGVTGLSPVAVDETTCAEIRFSYAPETQCLLWRIGEPTPRPIDAAEVAQYADIRNNPGNRRGVRCVEVRLPSPALADLGIVLVDTPGVGGLDAGAADLTLNALSGADAVLVVLTADGEISRAELDFIRRATRAVDTVTLALVRTDLIPDWQDVLAENAALLVDAVPDLAHARIVPFSSRLVERAATLSDSRQRSEREREAGLYELIETLRTEVTMRARVLHAANQLRFCAVALAGVEETAARRVVTSDPDPATLAELDRRVSALREAQYAQSTWRLQLSTKLQAIEYQQIDISLDKRIAALRAASRERAAAAKSATEFEQLATRLTNEAALAVAEADQEVELQLSRVLAEAFRELPGSAVASALRDPLEAISPAPDRAWKEGRRTRTLLEHYRNVWPAMGVHGLLASIAGSVVAGPIGLVAVAPFAVLAVRGQGALERRAHFNAWADEYLNDSLKVARRNCRARIGAVRDGSVDRDIHDLLSRQVLALTEQRDEAARQLEQDKQVREQAAAQARQELDAVRTLRAHVIQTALQLRTSTVVP